MAIINLESATLTNGASLQSDGSGHIAPHYVNFTRGAISPPASEAVLSVSSSVPFGFFGKFRVRGVGTFPGFPTLKGTFEITLKLSGSTVYHGLFYSSSDNTWGNATLVAGSSDPSNVAFDTIEVVCNAVYTSLDFDVFETTGTANEPTFSVSVPSTGTVGEDIQFFDTTDTSGGWYTDSHLWEVTTGPYPTGPYTSQATMNPVFNFTIAGTYYVSVSASLHLGPGSFVVSSLDHIIVISDVSVPPVHVTEFTWSQASATRSGVMFPCYGAVDFTSSAFLFAGMGNDISASRTYIPIVTGDGFRLVFSFSSVGLMGGGLEVAVGVYGPGLGEGLVIPITLSPSDAESGTVVIVNRPGWTIGSPAEIRINYTKGDTDAPFFTFESLTVTDSSFLPATGISIEALHPNMYETMVGVI